MRRRDFITLVGGAAAWPVGARAQQPERVRRIAMLSGFAASDLEAQARIAAFKQGLKELGWEEGRRNLHIDFRWNRVSGLHSRRSDTATSTGRMVRRLSPPIPMSPRSSPSCSTGTRPAAFL